MEAATDGPLDQVGATVVGTSRPSQSLAMVVPLRPQFSQMTLMGSQWSGWSTVLTVR